jgi:PqqA peptide cyclase
MKPKLSSKARIRKDPRDGTPVLLSPERGLRLSETAAAILDLCDGSRTTEGIVDALVARYSGADRGQVEKDVNNLLADMRRRVLLDAAPLPLARPSEERNAQNARTAERGRSPTAPADDSGFVVANGAPTQDTFSPYTLVAELTHRCPLACPYCSNPARLVRAQDELKADDWLRVLDESRLLGVMQMHLTGGEPLARSDLETIAARARALDLYVNLVTSGVPLERSRLERLAPSLDHVQLSVQDADGASSDLVAGTPSFDAKMQAAAWIKEMGLPLTLNVVVHRANLDRIEAIVALAERLGADRLELANVQLVSWAYQNVASLLPTGAQIAHARDVAREASQRFEGRMEVIFVLPDWYADRPRACMDGWGRRFVVVAPDGAVLPCHAARSLPLAFGSVREGTLAHAWRDAAGMKEFRGEGWMPDPCRTCDRRGIDYGGCRCQAFALTGDARTTDPACGLAPAHGLVREARLRAERTEKTEQRAWVYRGR